MCLSGPYYPETLLKLCSQALFIFYCIDAIFLLHLKLFLYGPCIGSHLGPLMKADDGTLPIPHEARREEKYF